MNRAVLIIDDDENDVLLTKRALLEIDPEIGVEAALSGEAGLALLRNGKELPDLVLLDLKMPGMCGVDTLRAIRADERMRHVPVVVVSSSSLDSDRQEACNAGADGFLHKAFNMGLFRRDIKSLLDRWLKNGR